MIRNTSMESYSLIVRSNLLPKMRMRTYKLLYAYGPMTANQLMQKARDTQPWMSHQAIESIGRRLSELRDCGVAYEVAEITCPISNRKVIQWDVTENLPRQIKKPLKVPCCHCGGQGYFVDDEEK